MSTVTYTPAEISGTLAMPPSKSAAHRAILCAALAKGVSTLYPIDPSQDMFATMEAVQAMARRFPMKKKPAPSPWTAPAPARFPLGKSIAGNPVPHCGFVSPSPPLWAWRLPLPAAGGFQSAPSAAIWTVCPITVLSAAQKAACPSPFPENLPPGNLSCRETSAPSLLPACCTLCLCWTETAD